MCNDIEIWFGIANGQILSYFCVRMITCVKCQVILTKLGTCIDIKEILFGIANGQISSKYDRVICPRHDNGRVLFFNVFISRKTLFLFCFILCFICMVLLCLFLIFSTKYFVE